MQLQLLLNFLSYRFISIASFYSSRIKLLSPLLIGSFFGKALIISQLFFINISTNADSIDINQSNQAEINYFIEFKPGIYNQPINSNTNQLLREINKRPKQEINIIGISQSASSLATYNLALLRAETIKKQLVRLGIEPSRLIVSGENENFVMPNEILHGVFVRSSKNNIYSKPSINTAGNETTQVVFIEFPAGVYNKAMPNQLDKAFTALLSLPDKIPLKLIGISQSKTNLATQPLALQRAKLVADQLIANGIEPSRISLGTEVNNHVQTKYLTHGVHIFANHSIDLNTNPKPVNILLEQLEGSNRNTIGIANSEKPIQRSSNKSIKPSLPNNQKSCIELNIKKGSLKKNIQREIADCGYLLGQWNFGTEEEYIDWIIPVAYKVNIDMGIFDILKVIETNYQIRAHVHELDKSIDFLPSIQYTKGQ
jgi:hypothetical protein